jgi:hypothetical protein
LSRHFCYSIARRCPNLPWVAEHIAGNLTHSADKQGVPIALALVPLWLAAALPAARLQHFFITHPSYRLLTIDDVRDEMGNADFTPVITADLTGDSVPEVAAVVVQTAAPPLYGVIVLHGPVVHWIVRPQRERILSISVLDGARLYVDYCLGCDSNSFVRWNGIDFESRLYAVGETVGTYDRSSDGHHGVALRVAPDAASAVIAHVPLCTDAKILSVTRPVTGKPRWYRVSMTVDGTTIIGFVPADALSEVSCTG